MGLFERWDRRNQRVLERANERARADSNDPVTDAAGGLFQLGGDLSSPIGLVLVALAGVVGLAGLALRPWRRRRGAGDA